MSRLPNLPLGVKFDPTEDQLILGYLGPQVRGERLAWNVIDFSDLVYKKPPWEFCTDLTTFLGDEKHYFFTELKKMNQNRVIRTVGSYGTWHESSSKKIFGGSNYINNNNRIIGFKKLLNFKVKGEGKEMKTTDWLMHEFSLPEKETNLVLCVIQKKKKKEEMGSAYDKYPEFDPIFFLVRDSTTSAGGDPCPAPAPAPAPAHDDQALNSEEEETRPSKKMRSDPKLDDDPVSGGDPCPTPAHDDQALDSEEEETRPSKKMPSYPKLDDDPVSGGDPCPAPAPAHDDQALDSEEEETRPSKKMPSDPKLDDHPVSVASSSVDLTPDFFRELEAELLEVPGLPDDGFGVDDCVLLDDLFFLEEQPQKRGVLLDDLVGLPTDVFGNVFVLSDLQTPSFEGDS